ncbi:heme exporter protein A [Desulfonatronum thiosulfatophilum]|uniref:Heme exporter protein A n=2 Tax=Desulfonatronum thiosulfatophilum TaxID=617002 RepID=A0A1G6A934_9BACT|nr:heme exporter protein A [Desulfonatronum thiosulfatophilum]
MEREDTGLVDLRKVSHFFGSRLVFRHVSLRIAPGEVLLVLGPNGAGKSTLLQIIAGLLTPTGGEIDWSMESGEIGYLGHGTCVYPFLTAMDNLQFWGRMHGLSPTSDAIIGVLDRVGLKVAALERAGTFSRGMAQRLSLARILLLNSRLLLLDEPATGLDTASRDILDREISQAKSRGAAVAWVSHDAQRDLRLADRVLVLENKGQAFLGSTANYSEWVANA